MTMLDLASVLAERGITLSVCLEADALPGALTDEVRNAIQEHKPALMVALAREAQWDALKDLRWAEPGTTESDAEYEQAERAAIQEVG